MFTENTNEIIRIRISKYQPPTSRSAMALEFYCDNSYKALQLSDLPEEQQPWIREMLAKNERPYWTHTSVYEFFDVDGQPMYPTLEQKSSPEGWVSFFLAVQAAQDAKEEKQRQERLLKNQQILRDIERWEQMGEMAFFEEYGDMSTGIPWAVSDVFEDEILQARLQKQMDLLDEVTTRYCKERDLQHRQWVKDFGSDGLREQVDSHEGLFISSFLEFPFFNDLSISLGLDPWYEPFRSYVFERMKLEHPEAIFSLYAPGTECANPTPEELKRAEELGGELLEITTFPELMESDENYEQVLYHLFVPPAVVVSVPITAGRAVYFLSGKPEVVPGLTYVLLDMSSSLSCDKRALITYQWPDIELQFDPELPEQRVVLGTHQFGEEAFEVCLSVVLNASGDVHEGRYLLLDAQGTTQAVSEVLEGDGVQGLYQFVELKPTKKPVAMETGLSGERQPKPEEWELTAIFERLPEDLRDKLRRRLLSEVDPVVALTKVIERGLM